MSERASAALAACLVALGACSPKTIALRATAALLDRGATAFYDEPDPEFAREAMPGQLKLLEALLQNEPSNPQLLERAAEGFNGYAFLFLEENQPDRARLHYLRGKDYGVALLRARGSKLASIDSMPAADAEKALTGANKDDLAGLFWTAYGWAGFVNLAKDSPDAVAALPKVVAIMRRVRELSPDYYFGGADLFLGSYYASLPKILGGDQVKAKSYFQSALVASQGHFLMSKVLFARYYAVAIQDPELFKRLLEEVLAESAAWPNSRLANEIAKARAKRLLEKSHELF